MSPLEKLFSSQAMIDAWNDFTDSLILEKLKEGYVNALNWSVEPETLASFEGLLKYYMIPSQADAFIKEALNARRDG